MVLAIKNVKEKTAMSGQDITVISAKIKCHEQKVCLLYIGGVYLLIC